MVHGIDRGTEGLEHFSIFILEMGANRLHDTLCAAVRGRAILASLAGYQALYLPGVSAGLRGIEAHLVNTLSRVKSLHSLHRLLSIGVGV